MIERYLTPYLLPPLIQALFSMALIGMVLWWHRRKVHRLFSLFLLTLTLWGIGILGMRASPNVDYAFYWEKGLLPVSVFMAVFFFHFTIIYTDTRVRNWLLPILYIICFLFIPFIFLTPLVLSGMQIKSYGYAPILGPAAPLWILFNYGMMTAALILFVRSYRKTHNVEQKNRFAYIIAGLSLCFVGIAFDLLPVAGLPLYPGGIIANILFCSLVTIAIVRHNLLDIRVVLRKGTAYVLTSAVIAIPFIVIFLLATKVFTEVEFPSWAYFVVAIILALVLPQLWQWFQRRVDRVYYRDRYDYLQALENFSRHTQSLTDSIRLGSNMVDLIAKALRSSNVYLLQPLPYVGDFTTAFSSGLNSSAPVIQLDKRSALVNWLERSNKILPYENIGIIPQLQGITSKEREALEQVGAKLFAPLKSTTGQLSGILVLGKKLSEQPYNSEDKQLIYTICNQMSTNLENARLYIESQREVRDRKRAEEKLQTILETALDGFWLANLEGKILEVNDSYCKMIGYTRQELLKMSTSDLEATESPEEVAQHINIVIEQGYDRFESQHKRKDGKVIDVEVSVNHLKVGEGQLFIFARDITERKLAEKALQESEEKLRQMFDSATDGILVNNLKGIITEVNQRTVEMHGFRSKDELLGKGAFDIVASRDREKISKNMRKALKRGIIKSVEYTLLKADGSEFPGELSTSMLKDASGNLVGHITIARDITERKQAEEREKELQRELYLSSRLASIGELAAGVAHQLNNPLTGILGFSQRLLRKSTEGEINQDLKRIYAEAERAARVVQNLLTFARRREPKKEYSNVNDIVRSALELRAYELKTSNIKVITDLAPRLPQAMLDFHQMQEVFLNLILNAEQAMTEANDGGKLIIKTEKVNGYIRAKFIDDGPGIPVEYLDSIFDPFFTTKGDKGGTGLGLSICHGIIKEHGGKIYAKSKPDKGTTLLVELPIPAKTTARVQLKAGTRDVATK